MTRFTFNTFIERGDDELEVRVSYDVSKHLPATYLQPAEGGDVEIIEAVFVESDTHPAPLTEAELDALASEAEENAPRHLAEEAADYADWQYEQYRDRKMMGDMA